jgi:hypothetical protein
MIAIPQGTGRRELYCGLVRHATFHTINIGLIGQFTPAVVKS